MRLTWAHLDGFPGVQADTFTKPEIAAKINALEPLCKSVLGVVAPEIAERVSALDRLQQCRIQRTSLCTSGAKALLSTNPAGIHFPSGGVLA